MKIMQLLDTLKIAFSLAHTVLRRHVFCTALMILVAWPGIVLGDSAGKHSNGTMGMSDFSVIFQEGSNRNPSEQSIMMDAHAQQTPIFQKTLDDETANDETAGSLPLDEELDDSRTRPECLPLITGIGAASNRTTTYYLTGGRTNPAPTLILAYDSEREDQFLYGMISLTIRW